MQERYLYMWIFRHGAHNWEGPGLLTAMKALDSLAEMTQATVWLPNKADAKHVVFAGIHVYIALIASFYGSGILFSCILL